MAEAHAEKVKETARIEANTKAEKELASQVEADTRAKEEREGVVHVGAEDAVPEDVTMDKKATGGGRRAKQKRAMADKTEAQTIEAEKPRPGIFRRKDKK
jgi:hypothetical protein